MKIYTHEFVNQQHEIHHIKPSPFQPLWSSYLGGSSNEISASKLL